MNTNNNVVKTVILSVGLVFSLAGMSAVYAGDSKKSNKSSSSKKTTNKPAKPWIDVLSVKGKGKKASAKGK